MFTFLQIQSQKEMESTLDNLNEVLAPFGKAIEIDVPSDLDQRANSLKDHYPEVFEDGKKWLARIDTAVARWMIIKESLGKVKMISYAVQIWYHHKQNNLSDANKYVCMGLI